MYEHVTEDQVVIAIDELQKTLGVKEEIPLIHLLSLLERNDVQGCVQRIAAWLGLPIRIVLSYVPKDFKPDSTEGFGSTSLARTDWTGHGMEAITAQVAIPQNLPMFGSRSLEGYPIRVRVSENCLDFPETFLAVMAHELSHVLLASIWHPHKDSELHTDLVPLLLGFRDIVRSGRKTVRTTIDLTTTCTTTYGYLPDEQFDFAFKRITSIVERYQDQKLRVSDMASDLRRLLPEAEQQLTHFRDYLDYVDAHPRRRMSGTHAKAVVQFHRPDYTRNFENAITQARSIAEKAESLVQSLVHYKRSTRQELHDLEISLASARDQLRRHLDEITRDVRVLRRYIPLLYPLRTHWWFRWLLSRLYDRA